MIFKIFRYLEYLALKFQGKGYGAISIDKEVSAVLRLLKGNLNMAIDIGANIGSYTERLLQSKPDIEVHLFEPASVNYLKLISKFENFSNVFINQLAVSNQNQASILYSNFAGSPLGSLSKRNLSHFNVEFEEQENIVSIKFEDYWRDILKMKAIDLVKMDIEGHELDALNGLGESIRSIKLIQFEFGGCNIDSRTYFQDFWYFFKNNNFELYRITPFGSQHVKQYREFDESFVTTNYLAKNKAL